MRRQLSRINQWEIMFNIFLGAWILGIPWIFGFGFEKYETNVVMWNFTLIGILVIGASVSVLKHFKIWPLWVTFYTGMWLLVSPLFLFYWQYPLLLWHSILFGALISGFSALTIPLENKKNHLFKRNLVLKNH